MSDQPQIHVEEIELTPLHIDVWRTALNALIAVAPGSTYDVAWHLADAREKTLTCRDFSAATQGEAALIDRLMLLAASKRAGAVDIGASFHSPELATPIGAEPVDMPTLSAAIRAFPSLLVPEARPASAYCSCARQGAAHRSTRPSPAQSPAAATPLTTHSAAPQAPQSDRS